MKKGKEARAHIGILGRRNNGKSSIINSLTGQEIAIVSDFAGTTTDPVRKSIEIHGIGPVVLIDTAGLDDTGELGNKRVEKTLEALKTIDTALLVICNNTFGQHEADIIDKLRDYDIPFFIIHNKSDITKLNSETKTYIEKTYNCDVIDYSAKDKTNNEGVIQLLRKHLPEQSYQSKSLIGDLLTYGDTVLLITPVDIEAPEGRLILPQVQIIRDILDNDCIAIVVKEREADVYIRKMNPRPKLAITDSQVFLKADATIPKDIPLTSFSIVLARHKGDFDNYIKGTPHISKLKDGDRILILESCTHHLSCDDIGRIKIPRWLSNFTGKKLEYDVIAGLSKLPDEITKYAMVIQCGGCVITRKQIISRLKPFLEAGIPVSNYGMTIAYIHGIFNRAIAPFVNQTDNKVDYL